MASEHQKEKKAGAEKNEDHDDKEGFLSKVKDFIHDVGEKIEEAVGVGKPHADVSAVHITSIDLERADLVVDVTVTNPNPIPIPLADVGYVVESAGRKLLSGLIPDAGTIRPHGSETLKVPLSLVYRDIRSTYADIKPGSVIPYLIRVEIIVDVPIVGRITLPMEKTGEIPVPHKPAVDLRKIKLGKLSLEETTANLHLAIKNENEFDFGVNSLEYEISLGSVGIGGARLQKAATIAGNGAGVIEIPITFRPKDFGSALWEMITGKGTGYSMKGSIEVDTPFGPMKLPFEKEGGRTRLRKAEDKDDDDESKD